MFRFFQYCLRYKYKILEHLKYIFHFSSNIQKSVKCQVFKKPMWKRRQVWMDSWPNSRIQQSTISPWTSKCSDSSISRRATYTNARWCKSTRRHWMGTFCPKIIFMIGRKNYNFKNCQPLKVSSFLLVASSGSPVFSSCFPLPSLLISSCKHQLFYHVFWFKNKIYNFYRGISRTWWKMHEQEETGDQEIKKMSKYLHLLRI